MTTFDQTTFISWKAEIPEQIARLHALLGQQVALDYSSASLQQLDDYLVANWANIQASESANAVLSWSAAYIGETYIRQFQANWSIVTDNINENVPIHMYSGLPHVLIRPPAFLVCPHAQLMTRISRLQRPDKRQISLQEVFESTRTYLAKHDSHLS